MAFFQSLRWPQSAPPKRRLSLPATCMVLTRMAVFWNSTLTACLISCLVALGATLRTYWLCFSARAVPFSVTRTDLRMRRGSRIEVLFFAGDEKLTDSGGNRGNFLRRRPAILGEKREA